MHEYVLIYAKNSESFRVNLLPRSEELNASYSNPDNDPRGPWTTNAIQARNYYSQGSYEIQSPTGKKFIPPQGTYWRVSSETYQSLLNDNRIWWGKNSESVPRIKKFLSEAKNGVIPATLWLHTEAGQNAEAKAETRNLFGENVGIFLTPKPERLIKQILTLASNEDDIVLDSFLGSGTTAAVAHKMKRKWIGIEVGEHAITHSLPRLKKVVSGEDKGGISESVNWKKGGGFKFYTIAPSLIQKDKYGSEIINPAYNSNMLGAAMAKQEGFRYSPDENSYWKQGFSSEKDFIFTTTQFITIQMLDRLAEELQPGESLLVCCKSFAKGCANRHSNITIKKIPQMLLGRCEFGKDDYSFNIINLPNEDENAEEHLEILNPGKILKLKKKKADDDSQPSLF